MINFWIESVFIKRVALAMAATVAAQWVSHSISILHHLSGWGIVMSLKINQDILAQHLTSFIVGVTQGLHEWIGEKYPLIGKWI